MKIVGTICEYNPFHNGHYYQLQEIRRISKCDVLVVVLSTYFTMRGELSLHSPFEKANYALHGADLVIALPAILACNSADKFAKYAIRELAKIGVSEIYFGSEENDISLYEKTDKIYLDAEERIRNNVKNGQSYKKATADSITLKSNDLLGYCYYKAIKEIGYPIEVKTIKRIGDEHGTLLANNQIYTSSSAIRNNLSLIETHCPNFVDNKNLLDPEKLFSYFKFLMEDLSSESFSNLSFISEGIENLIIKKIKTANSLTELITIATTSRYTKSRIRRSIFHLLFLVKKFDDSYPFTRVLGYTKNGRDYLSKIKKQINLVTNIKEGLDVCLDYELKIAKILDLIYNTSNLKYEQSKPVEFISN